MYSLVARRWLSGMAAHITLSPSIYGRLPHPCAAFDGVHELCGSVITTFGASINQHHNWYSTAGPVSCATRMRSPTPACKFSHCGGSGPFPFSNDSEHRGCVLRPTCFPSTVAAAANGPLLFSATEVPGGEPTEACLQVLKVPVSVPALVPSEVYALSISSAVSWFSNGRITTFFFRVCFQG